MAVALIEAKSEQYPATHGLQQSKLYAATKRLNVPFVYSTNGHQFVEYDAFTGLTHAPRPLSEFPTPEDLKQRYESGKGFSLDGEGAKPLVTPYAKGEAGRRYYQDAAIRSVFEKVAQGDKRALLSLATGSGKTFIAVSGSTPRGGQTVYQTSGIPLIRSQNVLMNSFTLEGMAYVSDSINEGMANTIVEPQDVLINITGASIGRVCVVPSAVTPANVNQHVCIVRPKDRINPRFLSYYLSNGHFQHFIMTNQAGGTRQALTKVQVENFDIPLPSLSTQGTLVGELDEYLAAATLAEESILQELETIEAMPAALLRKAFSGEL